jgi:hypothetical protein
MEKFIQMRSIYSEKRIQQLRRAHDEFSYHSSKREDSAVLVVTRADMI